MKKIFVFGLLLIVIVSFVSCAAGPNEMVNTMNEEGKTAGFWRGLWHGLIIFVTFVISLFKDSVGVYEVHNNGGWYNFGFVLGAIIIFSGSHGAGRKTCTQKKELE